MLNIFGFINFAFGLLGALAGVIVLRGIFHRPLSSGSTVRFLMGSLFASLAGLMPITRHVTPVQLICMLSVYCSAAATLAWLKFGLATRHWRRIFTLCLTAILYFDIIFVATWLSKTPPLMTAPLTMPLPSFQLAQILFAAAFIVLGILAARKCPIGPASVTSLGKLSHTH